MPPEADPPRTATARICALLAQNAPPREADLAAQARTSQAHVSHILAALRAEAIIAPDDLRVLDPPTLRRLAQIA